MKKLSGKDVALSGVSAALAIIFVFCAIYVYFATLSFYVLAAISVSLPLMRKNFIAATLSYFVSGLVAFFVGNIQMMPYILFFGLYSLVSWLLDFYFYEKININKWIKIAINVVIKIGFFALIFWGIYVLMNLTVADFSNLMITNFWILVLIAFFVFVLYDIIYREIFKLLSKLITRRIYHEQ